MRSLLSFCFLLSITFTFAQDEIQHVEPPYWWYNMESSNVEIMIHGDNINKMKVKLSNAKINIDNITRGHSPNYLFVDLNVSAIKEQKDFEIILTDKDREIRVPYSLKTRRPIAQRSKGITPADAIYLITPDRFRNANTANDNVNGYKEELNRTDDYGRHGGDIEGIIQSLDYIDDLGFNSVWLNPVLDNDMKSQSYHGYATTDYYKVDDRFGGNKAYEDLRDQLAAKDMNLIMDMIANHCGSSHWWMDDLPFSDWLNFQKHYESKPVKFDRYSNHRKTTILDPYSSKIDRQFMTDGWFVESMPDLNQRNQQMERYLIQNSIWWVEKMNLAGIRQDTYSYPDEGFLAKWSCALSREYPDLFVVGEEWTDNPLIVSHWQSDEKSNESRPSSCLPSVMDFPMQMTVSKALTDPETWNTGLPKMYELMVNDIMYGDPSQLVIFPDNHDMSRVYTQMEEDFDLWKIALTYYATMRGIPQIYYGTEVIMGNKGTTSHGVIRSEYQGGWDDHDKNYFTQDGMSAQEIEAFEFTKKLFSWRKNSRAVHEGKLMHFAPVNGIYVYFRYTDQKKIMVVINKNDSSQNLELDRFQEIIMGSKTMKNVMSEVSTNIGSSLEMPAKSAQIYTISM